MIVVALLLTSQVALAQQPAADWVVSPGPEAADASAAGADLRKRAQALGAEKKFDEALPLLEEAARTFPSSEHDCFLSLGYLRANQLTRAQLFMDLSALRNGARPEWCTGSLPREIATQLRSAQFVPVTFNVQPADSVIELAGIRFKGIPVLWLRQGTYKVTARFEARPDAVAHVLVAAPSTSVSMTVTAPDTPVVEPKVEVTKPPPLIEQTPPAVVVEKPVEPPPPPPLRWPGWVGVGVGGVAVVTGAVNHARASAWRDRANEQVQGSGAFNHSVSEFQTARGIALAGYAVGAAAVGFGIWWLMTHSDSNSSEVVGSAAP